MIKNQKKVFINWVSETDQSTALLSYRVEESINIDYLCNVPYLFVYIMKNVLCYLQLHLYLGWQDLPRLHKIQIFPFSDCTKLHPVYY